MVQQWNGPSSVCMCEYIEDKSQCERHWRQRQGDKGGGTEEWHSYGMNEVTSEIEVGKIHAIVLFFPSLGFYVSCLSNINCTYMCMCCQASSKQAADG